LQLGDARVHGIGNYIGRGKLWETFAADTQPVIYPLTVAGIDRGVRELQR